MPSCLCEYKAFVNAYKCEITEKSHFLFVNGYKIERLKFMIKFIIKSGRLILPALIIMLFALSAWAKQPAGNANDKIVLPACPDWVNPNVRKDYPGYAIRKKRKKNSPAWKHLTNRPGGNIQGGGTTQYYDYKPFYVAPKRRPRSWKKRI